MADTRWRGPGIAREVLSLHELGTDARHSSADKDRPKHEKQRNGQSLVIGVDPSPHRSEFPLRPCGAREVDEQ